MCHNRCSFSFRVKAERGNALGGGVRSVRFFKEVCSDVLRRGLLLKALVFWTLYTTVVGTQTSKGSTMLATLESTSAAFRMGPHIHPVMGSRDGDSALNNQRAVTPQYQTTRQDQHRPIQYSYQVQQQSQEEPVVLYTKGQYSSADRPFRIENHTLLQSALKIFEQNDFTIMANLQQQIGSQAILLSLDQPAPINKGLLEITISSQHAEVSIWYRSPAGVWRRKVFPYVQLANNQFHNISLRFTGNQVALFIDCTHKGKLSLSGGRAHITQDAQLVLFDRREADAFLDEVRYVYLAAGPQALQRFQCPWLVDESQQDKDERLAQLVQEQQRYKKDLDEVRATLRRMQQSVDQIEKIVLPVCEIDQARTKKNLETWKDGCKQCTCENKNVTCIPLPCPSRVNCSDPMLDPCCKATCGRNCSDGADILIHGDSVYTSRSLTGCIVKTCNAGVITFNNKTCPPLACPEEDRALPVDGCCPICLRRHCGTFLGACAENAHCSNHMMNPRCTCDQGYKGDGVTKCEDIDECASKDLNHCSGNSVCENTPGGYNCNCKEGYRMDSVGHFCVDINECAEKDFCDSGATCINTNGGFRCVCPEGYRSEGRACKPVCTTDCQHGGYCKAPGLCECRPGYRGDLCQYDIDECAGSNMCGKHAICINQPGHYYCQCKDGFQLEAYNGTLHCADINECAMDPYTCPSGCNCINREGSFTCACPAVDSSGANVTSWSCRVVDRRLNFSGSVNDGSSFSIERGCTSYTCRRGTPLRSSFSCDCSDPQQMHRACCPHCFQEEKSQCRLRATDGSIEVVANGQRFIQDCEICTCSFGSVRCSKPLCPPLSCPNPQQPPGLCCPICPDQDACAPVSPLGGFQESRPRSVGDRGCHLPPQSLFIESSQNPWARISSPKVGEPELRPIIATSTVASTSTSSHLQQSEQPFPGVSLSYLGIACLLLIIVVVMIFGLMLVALRRRHRNRTGLPRAPLDNEVQTRHSQ
ncbi:protein kinase C-binding protein NELL2-like isoform X2 [Varroa destructor]|uniref:Uncharacterized protein n=1 Tax=Varroa destructor TaxID=109461 RepID=A0A7M7KJ61_VARDE|nr:protein kinase C-binding protein NELL2-like isoform X2 [Varroa destructor]